MAIQKLEHVDTEMVERMARLLTNQSAEEVQRRLGIGANTWAKIRKGKPIRQSVVVRLVERVHRTLDS